MNLANRLVGLVVPLLLVLAVTGLGSLASSSNEIYFLTALVDVVIVVGLYVFVGNSGVLSFGQMSFVAVGAFAAGLLTIPPGVKRNILPDLFPVLERHSTGNLVSLLLAAALGADMLGTRSTPDRPGQEPGAEDGTPKEEDAT